MVIMKNNENMKSLNSKDSWEKGVRAKKINASTDYDICSEQLSPFGGLLGLIKFLDLIKLINQNVKQDFIFATKVVINTAFAHFGSSCNII